MKNNFIYVEPDSGNFDFIKLWHKSYILNLLSVCPGSFQALPRPLFFCFFFLDGFCFLWQLLLDGCIMHQVHTSYK